MKTPNWPGMVILLVWLAALAASSAATTPTEAKASDPVSDNPPGGPKAEPRKQRRMLAADDSQVRAVLQRWVDKDKRSPGIAVGIIDAKGPRVITYGRSGNPARPQVDGDTLFEIGSITKTFTATLLADMVKRGEVGLETPLRVCLPSRLRLPPRGAGDITLRQLATHTSGFPRLPLEDPGFLWSMVREFRNPYRRYSREQLFAYLEWCDVNPARSNQVEYSNLGMGILGEALAGKANSDYGTLLADRVLAPLGMSNTWVRVPAARRALLAAGHNACQDTVSHWDLPSLAGAGAVQASISDMLKFLAANINGTQPIDPMLHKVMVPVEPIATALAWQIMGTGDTEFVWHNGGTGGFTSFIGFYPADKAGVVILNNSDHSVDELALHLLEPKIFKLEFATEPAWFFLPLLLSGLMVWRAGQPADPSGMAKGRRFLPKPMTSRLQMVEHIVEVAIVAIVLWKTCAWPYWGRFLRVVFVILFLLMAIRLVLRARELPWVRQWGWAKWLYHGVEAVVCALLMAFVIYSL